MKKRFLTTILFFFTSIATVALLEGVLRLAGQSTSQERFSLYRRAIAESTYFHDKEDLTPPEIFPHFDSLLGWRNYTGPNPSATETLNKGYWRSHYDFSPKKRKKRIALVGDSFVYGFQLPDEQTIQSHLQKRMGEKYEVMNFGVHGFGTDQIALTANRIAPTYQPDYLVIGFIADDLVRSCNDFGFNARKPVFDLDPQTGQLILKGVPVQTPPQTYQEHRTTIAQLKDSLLVQLGYSRLFSLVAQVVLQRSHTRCLETINPLIFQQIAQHWKNKAKLLFVHLDGKLPERFEKQLSQLGVQTLSMPPVIEYWSNQLNIKPERLPDGHPKGSLNRIYAEAIYAALKGSWS